MTYNTISQSKIEKLRSAYEILKDVKTNSTYSPTYDKSRCTPLEIEAIELVESILKNDIEVTGFMYFKAFTVRKGGKITMRFEHYWDSSFHGVGYLSFDEIDETLMTA